MYMYYARGPQMVDTGGGFISTCETGSYFVSLDVAVTDGFPGVPMLVKVTFRNAMAAVVLAFTVMLVRNFDAASVSAMIFVPCLEPALLFMETMDMAGTALTGVSLYAQMSWTVI